MSTPIGFDGDNASQTFNNAQRGCPIRAPTQRFGDGSLNLYISGSTNDPSPTSTNLLYSGAKRQCRRLLEPDRCRFADLHAQERSRYPATLVNTGLDLDPTAIAIAGTDVVDCGAHL